MLLVVDKALRCCEILGDSCHYGRTRVQCPGAFALFLALSGSLG